MPYNREIIASIAFESEPLSKATTPNGHLDDLDASDAAGKRNPQQSEATLNIIRCMKWALAKSITSISHPEKQRPLNPKKDFTIETKIEVTVDERGKTGFGCCGGGAGVGSVKRPRVHTLSLQEKSESMSNVAESDIDPEDDVEVPPVSFRFIDYSPMCYRHIREFFNINPRAYCEVLMRSQWHSTPTPGKSAAQLFFCGKDWVIKTMTLEESEFLRSILHRYYFFVLDNPYTLLPHFVGHHRLEIGDKKIYVVIMQNVFATRNTIHEKYDIKGSTVGRFATAAEKMKQTCTQKDLDLNRPIHIGPVRRALLIEQIKKDCNFLRRSSIMDFSFLVGIHVLPTHDSRNILSPSFVNKDLMVGTSSSYLLQLDGTMAGGLFDGQQCQNNQLGVTSADNVIDGRCFTADQGGMMCADHPGSRREIYYAGIVDILQEYNLRKRLETFVYGVVKDRKKISSVPPKEYAIRFLTFISSIIA